MSISRRQKLEERIKARMDQRYKDAFANGKDIDELVKLDGGIKYGNKTIERLAERLDCSARQLRRDWHGYLLREKYGPEIRKITPALKASYWSELARLLEVGLPEADEKRLVLEYVKWKSKHDELGMQTSVDQLQKAITNAVTKIRAGEDRKPYAPNSVKEKPKPDIIDLVAFRENGLEGAADYLVSFAEPEHLKACDMAPNRLFQQTNRIAGSLTQLVEHLMGTDQREDVTAVTQRLVRRLNTVLATLDDDQRLKAVNE